MRVAVLTRENPPQVYGGAGVHVAYLARELARLEEVTVHCWGADRRDGCERTALEAADALIAVSEGMRRDVLDLLPGDRARARRGDLQRHRRPGVPAR